MNSKKPAIVLFLALAAAVGIIFWGVAFNQASLVVTSDLAPFQINLANQTHDCPSSPCQVSINPKRYQVRITKTGHSTQTEDINPDRNERITIEYTALSLPRLKPIDQTEAFDPGYFKINDAGEQLLYIRTPDQGDIVATTFKQPLSSPNLRVSPERDYAFVWDTDIFPSELFLVDLPLKTKQSFSFPNNEVPNDIKFLNDRQVLLENDDQIRLHDLDTNQNFFFPIASLNHIQPLNNNQALLISESNLDEFNLTNQGDVSFEELLESTTDDLIFNTNQGTNQTKLYYYLRDTDSYTLLFELEEEFPAPHTFFRSQIESQTEIVLQSNDNFHLIQVDL